MNRIANLGRGADFRETDVSALQLNLLLMIGRVVPIQKFQCVASQ